LKDNIEELSFGEDPLAIVDALSIRQFSFKSDETHSLYHGLIAQEVETIAPELVVTRSDGYLAVKYGDIQWVVVRAMQQLSRLVREQTATIAGILDRLSGHDTEIEHLRDEIESLRTQVNALGGQGGGGAGGNETPVFNGDEGTEETPDEDIPGDSVEDSAAGYEDDISEEVIESTTEGSVQEEETGEMTEGEVVEEVVE